MTSYQTREAKRLGLTCAIETARNTDYQRKMRRLREQNARRARGDWS